MVIFHSDNVKGSIVAPPRGWGWGMDVGSSEVRACLQSLSSASHHKRCVCSIQESYIYGHGIIDCSTEDRKVVQFLRNTFSHMEVQLFVAQE